MRDRRQTAVIIDAVRWPIGRGRAPRDGRPGGALSSLHPVGLLGQVLRSLMDRNSSPDPAGVDVGETVRIDGGIRMPPR